MASTTVTMFAGKRTKSRKIMHILKSEGSFEKNRDIPAEY